MEQGAWKAEMVACSEEDAGSAWLQVVGFGSRGDQMEGRLMVCTCVGTDTKVAGKRDGRTRTLQRVSVVKAMIKTRL